MKITALSILSLLLVAQSASAAEYVCKTVIVNPENKAGTPRLSFRLTGTSSRNALEDFYVTPIKGYTTETVGTSDGGVDYKDTYAEIFMSNGCDTIVQLNFPKEAVAQIRAGTIQKVSGMIASAGAMGGPELTNVMISCTRN